MLTLEREQTTLPLNYANLNTSIQETFTAIDRFECFAVDEILQMREQQLYLQAGYKNFSEYCQRELYTWGGYRRINQLLRAKKVIDTVGELGGHIKNERQARLLLRLVKEPEKLKQPVAIANQTQGQVKQGYSALLSGENQVSGVEVKGYYEGTGSAASVPNPEKWSHEAIVARANARPERMQKLKVAGNSGENPGFDFLLSCWNDDPAKADCD